MRAPARKLHCDSVRIRENYANTLNQLLDRHRMFKKLNNLHKLQDDLSLSEFMLLFNKWDRELTELMLAAENKCHQYKQCHIPYSPEVAEWITRRWLLGRIRRYLQGKVPDPRNLYRQCRKHRVPDPRDLSEDDLNIEIFLCAKKIEELKPLAPKLRREHLKACLADAKQANDLDRVLAIENIIRRENTKKRWRRVNLTTAKSTGGAVLSVKVPTAAAEAEDANSFQEFTTADDIFNSMSDTLSERFRLAFPAKSYSGKLFDDIGYIGDTEASRQILEGTYEFAPDEDPGTRLLLEEAAHTYSKMSQEEVAAYVTVDDFQYYWQRANERISSSYSGLHFSHYKAASFDIGLSSIHCMKLSMAAKAGVPLDRWGIGVTVLLEKICGNNYAHKLRAICLLEADFNWWNKLVFARRMMKLAKEKGVIPEESFAKQGSHVNNALMAKTFFADISKVLHWPAALGGCDFGDCYDRAAHGPASIGLQAWGITPKTVSVLLKAMMTMQFCLRTGFGESKQFYGGSEDNPLAGFGQGNGAAPPGFSALSSLIVNAYKRMGENGAKLTSCYTARMFLLAAVMYVDDTDLCHMAPSQTSTDEALIARTQRSTNGWGSLAIASGGALKPPKCFMYYMSFKFPGGKPRLKSLKDLPPPSSIITDEDGKQHPSHITVPMPDGTDVPIPTLDVKTPTKMLGSWFTPIGDGSHHIASCRQKGIDWVDRNHTKPLPACDAWLSFHMQLIPGMSWGLLSAIISPKDLNDAIGSLYFKILPLLRVNRNITKAWRTIPQRFQGLGMPDFVVMSFACQVYFMQCFWGFDDMVGTLLHFAYEAFQMEVGLGGDIFVRSFDKLGFLATEGTWFRHFWQYASHLGITVKVASKYHLQPLRINDIPFMDFLVQKDIPKDVLLSCNRVRKFNKLTYLSECVLCDGRSIDTRVLNRDVKPKGKVQYSFEKPSPSDFKTWNNVIKTISSPNLTLRFTLGAQLRTDDKCWFVSGDRLRIFRRRQVDLQSVTDVFCSVSRRYATRRGQQYRWEYSTYELEESGEYASVLPVDDFLVTLHSVLPVPAPSPAPSTDFWDILRSFENQSLWTYFRCDGDGSWITKGLMAGSLICVHDGSYMVHMSRSACSAGFVIRCRSTGYQALGTIVEQSDDASNYRGEILGGMMMMLVLRAATGKTHLPYRQVTVNCDNNGVVSHGNDPSSPLPEKQVQADVLRCLKQYITDLPVEVVYEWVKAHQDDRKAWDDLTLKEQCNCLADKLAKMALISAILNNEYIDGDFPFELLRVVLGTKKLTSSPKKAFDSFWGYRCAKNLYSKRGIISRDFFHLVWWTGVEALNQSVPKMFSVFLTKHTSHFAGTNQQLHRIDKSVENICPSCGRRGESTKHITRCRDEGRVAMLNDSVKELTRWLYQKDTDDDMVAMVREYLLAQGEKTMSQCSHPSRYESLVKAHDKLGWDNFLEGRICTLFLEAYRCDLEDDVSPYQVDSWGRGFIERLIRITHAQWIFRNSHVHYKKLEGMTEAQHMDIFRRVEELMWTDPMELLPAHRHLLEEDLQGLGECSSATRLYWVLSVEAAQKTAEHVLAGKATKDRYRMFMPRKETRITTQATTRQNGSVIYRARTRTRGK